MNTLKIISFLILSYAFSFLNAQDNYLLDSLISLDVLNNELDNRTVYSYDDQDRITRELSFTRLEKYSYPSTNKVELEIFSISDTTQYSTKQIQTIDAAKRITYVETYEFDDGTDVLITKDSLRYKDDDTEHYFYMRTTILDGVEYVSTRIEFFHNDDGFIDSTSVVNFKPSGEILSSINRGITLNAFNQDSIVANRRFFNEVNFLDSSYLAYDNQELIELKTVRYEEGVFDETFLFTYVREGNKLTQIGNRSSDNVNFVHYNDIVFWETENEFFEYDSTHNINYVNDIPTSSRNMSYESVELSASQVLVSEVLKRTVNGQVVQVDQEDSYYRKKNTVDIDQVEKENFTLFPNPIQASCLLNLEAKDMFNRIVIHDVSGAVLQNKQIESSKFSSINAPSKSGIYMVTLYQDTKQIAHVQQIIVVN